MTRAFVVAVLIHASCQFASSDAAHPIVSTLRVPNEGIQPQIVVGKEGVVHMVYYTGEAASGDIFYVHSNDGGKTFSTPMRVNSQPESAIAAGTIRGAHLALGKNDRVHVAWNGSGKAKPKGLPNPQLPEDNPYRHSAPMLYARMNAEGTGFETQRNLMTSTYSLDGGGSVAADGHGNVYVVWHGNSTNGASGEGARAVWVAASRDDGETFAPESRANREETGACGCCGLRATADRLGNVFVLYRSAMNTINRDMYVLMSKDKGKSFVATKLDTWKIGQCVMSSATLHTKSDGTLASWETEHQVKFAQVDGLLPRSQPRVSAPNMNEQTRKHPVLCSNSKGQVILAWTEGTGWQKGGSVAWQVFDNQGNAVAGGAGQASGLPVWGLVAVFSGPNDEFTVVY